MTEKTMLDIYSRNIVENINDAFVAVDRNWRITYANYRVELLLQKSREDLLNTPIQDVFPAAICTVLSTLYQNTAEALDVIKFDGFFSSINKWFEMRAYPLKNDLFIYLSDITDRKHAEKALRTSELLKQAILDSLTAHIAVLDQHGTIIAVNDAWEKYAKENSSDETGCQSGIGVNYLDMCQHVAGEDAVVSQKAFEGIQSVLKGEQAQFNLEYPCNSPTEKFWYLMNVTPLAQGHGAVMSHIDITERKVIEQRKDDFISTASHELQTPMTTLKGLVQLLKKKVATQDMSKFTIYLPQMEAQVNTLTKLVVDLLDVSKIQSGRVDYFEEDIDFDALIHEIVESFQQINPKHSLFIHGESKEHLIGDADRIKRVFVNLITNAIKYSPQADRVDITISSSNDQVTFSVRDYGIGIAENYQEKIFERLYRIYPLHDKATPGLGMGLYISNEVVRHYGGKISIESKVGEGSIFSVSLPLRTG